MGAASHASRQAATNAIDPPPRYRAGAPFCLLRCRTSTIALCNATLPYALRIANKGYEKAAAEDPGLAEGINLVGGRVTNAAVAQSLHLQHQPLGNKGAA